MAFIYIDDGEPESVEFENNYIYFDEKNPKALSKAFEFLKRNRRKRLLEREINVLDKETEYAY